MIRYDTDRAGLLAAIAATDPTWSAKTAQRTRKFIDVGCYAEKSSLWAPVKPVYMRVQHYKCVFCERRFENQRYGRIEFDVEHFRPKSSVAAWPDAERHRHLAYDFPTGAASETGYYWLAYDVENYAASCKVCNTALKSNYFPVAGGRGAVASDSRALAAELPFLCYPLGRLDADPEGLVTFTATTAIPAAAADHARRRGQIIIDFFDLNGRELLHRERAQMIAMFGGALTNMAEGRARPADERVAAGMTDPALPHAACLRAFRRLWQKDAAAAAEIYDRCRDYVIDQTASAPPEL